MNKVDVLEDIYQMEDLELGRAKRLIREFKRTIASIPLSGKFPEADKLSGKQLAYIRSLVGDSMSVLEGTFCLDDGFQIVFDPEEIGKAVESGTIIYNTFQCKASLFFKVNFL